MNKGIVALVAAVALWAPGLNAQETARITIQEAANLALQSYPSLDVAEAGVAMARARLRSTRATRLPGVFFSGSATRFQEPMIVAPLHSFNLTAPPVFDRTLFQSEWSASFDLFDGGSRGAQIDASRTGIRSSEARETGARIDVITLVAETYLNLLSAVAIDEAATRQIGALEAEVNRADALFEEGRAARVQVLRARAALAAARAERVTTASNIESLTNDLARLTGTSVETGAVREVSLRNQSSTARFVETDIVDNPRLRDLREQVAGADARLRAARGARLPHVAIQSSVVTFGSASGGFSGEWRGGVGVSYPIFTGGARGGAIDQAEAGVWQARETLRTGELETQAVLERALITVREIDSRSVALQEALSHQEEVARIELIALETGAGVQTDYLRAEAELFQARAALISLRHNAITARIRVAALTGELSASWLETHLESST